MTVVVPGAAPGCYLLSELNDQRQLVGLDKSQDVFFGHLAIKGIAPFIELQKDKKLFILPCSLPVNATHRLAGQTLRSPGNPRLTKEAAALMDFY